MELASQSPPTGTAGTSEELKPQPVSCAVLRAVLPSLQNMPAVEKEDEEGQGVWAVEGTQRKNG